MILTVETDLVDQLIESIFEIDETLPKPIISELEAKFPKNELSDLVMGFHLLTGILKMKAGKLHTKLDPACFYSVVSELSSGDGMFAIRIAEFYENCNKQNNALFSRLKTCLTPDAVFGAVIAYNTLRRKDESNRHAYISERIK